MTHQSGVQLEIPWHMQSPPVSPREWVHWQPPIPPHTCAEDERLTLPPGTLAVLRAAFEQSLNRFQGWQVDAETPATLAAAAIFKRGVSVRSQTQATVVEEKSGCYTIDINPSESLNEVVEKRSDTYYIIDAHVAEAWPALKSYPHICIVPTSELSKTVETAATILRDASAFSGIKQWTIIGGGVLADTAAFAAGLVDTPFQLFPTTLLAMADACVGGKTGVNFAPYGKNQVGLFNFPQRVCIWPRWLETLPRHEVLSGGSECLKHAFLKGDRDLAHAITRTLSQPTTDVLDLIQDIVRVKADVVRQDPGESGIRASLNFGHTLAHALEALSHEVSPKQYLLHGEAVAVGMLFAAELSAQHLNMPAADCDFIHKCLQASHCLPTKQRLRACLDTEDVSGIWPDLIGYLTSDKKRQADGMLSWVLMTELGAVHKGPESNYLTPLTLEDVEPRWQVVLDRVNE